MLSFLCLFVFDPSGCFIWTLYEQKTAVQNSEIFYDPEHWPWTHLARRENIKNPTAITEWAWKAENALMPKHKALRRHWIIPKRNKKVASGSLPMVLQCLHRSTFWSPFWNSFTLIARALVMNLKAMYGSGRQVRLRSNECAERTSERWKRTCVKDQRRCVVHAVHPRCHLNSTKN